MKDMTLTLDGRNVTARDIMALTDSDLASMPQHLADLYAFLHQWFDDNDAVPVTTSGSTGQPKTLQAEKSRMVASAVRTCDFLGVKQGDRALLCMNLKYIGAKMMVVRAMVRGLDLVVVPVTGHPMSHVHGGIDFAALVPMQLYNTLGDAEETEKLSDVRNIIIGGGAVSNELESRIDALKGRVYSTYGMTETLSHIAMRRLGKDGERCYRPLEGVTLTLSADNTLVIDAPEICPVRLVTNDIAQLHADGSFTIMGRLDNVINSGGIKIMPEQIEMSLQQHLDCPLAVTSVPDDKFGEAVTLLVGRPWAEEKALAQAIGALPSWHRPKHIFRVESIPQTPNGKTARSQCRLVAGSLAGSHAVS